jgi:hypothetical protein
MILSNLSRIELKSKIDQKRWISFGVIIINRSECGATFPILAEQIKVGGEFSSSTPIMISDIEILLSRRRNTDSVVLTRSYPSYSPLMRLAFAFRLVYDSL